VEVKNDVWSWAAAVESCHWETARCLKLGNTTTAHGPHSIYRVHTRRDFIKVSEHQLVDAKHKSRSRCDLV